MATRSLINVTKTPDAADVSAKAAEASVVMGQIAQAQQLAGEISKLSSRISNALAGSASSAYPQMLESVSSACDGMSSAEATLLTMLQAAKSRPVVYHVEETWNIVETFYTEEGKEYTEAHTEVRRYDEVGAHQLP